MLIQSDRDYRQALFELRRLRFQRYLTKYNLKMTAGEDYWNILEALDATAKQLEEEIASWRERRALT